MQNRQNGCSRRPAAHSSNLAISGLSIENDAPRAARGKAPCASVLEPHNKPKCSRYLCNEKNTMRASPCPKLWSSSMTFYAQIQAISLIPTSLTCTCGSRAESFFARMQVGSALAWHSYACIQAGMSALELLLGLGGWPPRHSFMHPQLAVHVS